MRTTAGAGADDGVLSPLTMRVLSNRNVRARDAWRAVLNVRAASRHAVRCCCRECGFVAGRALERCPACGQWDWPFDPVRHTPDPARPAQARQSFHSWPSRIARTLRNAAFRRPSASSAPILSLLTLVLLVGGYVAVDRTCKADPVCRKSGASTAAATETGVPAANEPTPPVLPAPVFPFHVPDGTPLAGNPQYGGPNAGEPVNRMQVAQARPSMHAPDRARPGAIRVADWNSSRDATHRTHAVRRVSLHTRHARYTAASNAEIAKLYRGH